MGYHFCCMMTVTDSECQFTNTVKIITAYKYVFIY